LNNFVIENPIKSKVIFKENWGVLGIVENPP